MYSRILFTMFYITVLLVGGSFGLDTMSKYTVHKVNAVTQAIKLSAR